MEAEKVRLLSGVPINESHRQLLEDRPLRSVSVRLSARRVHGQGSIKALTSPRASAVVGRRRRMRRTSANAPSSWSTRSCRLELPSLPTTTLRSCRPTATRRRRPCLASSCPRFSPTAPAACCSHGTAWRRRRRCAGRRIANLTLRVRWRPSWARAMSQGGPPRLLPQPHAGADLVHRQPPGSFSGTRARASREKGTESS